MSSSSLRIIFAGTPIFAAKHLEILIKSKHKIIKVLTKPDNLSKRGKKIIYNPVKLLAQSYNLPILQPKSLYFYTKQDLINNFKCDIIIVVAYGLILPKNILNIPYFGCINVHGSLLPRWRGAAPIQRSILSGDKITGVTIIQMNEGIDTGNILNTISCKINNKDTSFSIQNKLIKLGPQLLIKTLYEIQNNISKPIIQNDKLATYAHKLTKQEARLNWSLSAEYLERSIRAFNPWPISFFIINNQIIKVWQASILINVNKTPGKIIYFDKYGIKIATISGALNIEIIQLSGKKPILVKDFLNAYRKWFIPGTILI